MYLLEMIECVDYEGTYTTSIVVSSDKQKLDILATTLKHDLFHVSERMNNFRSYLDDKYSSLRFKCQRTDDEIIELNSFQEDLKQQYHDVLKYDLFGSWFSVSDIEFEVKEIDLI